jgi:hypothetical protein
MHVHTAVPELEACRSRERGRGKGGSTGSTRGGPMSHKPEGSRCPSGSLEEVRRDGDL